MSDCPAPALAVLAGQWRAQASALESDGRATEAAALARAAAELTGALSTDTSQRRGRAVCRPSAVYPETAILDKRQVCDGLGISERQLERLDLPTVYLGGKTPRFIWRQVLAALEGQSL